MKNRYHFAILEDVPIQRANLLHMLEERMDLHCVKTFETAEQAFDFLCASQDQPLDILFLDIELPEHNGLALLNAMKNLPRPPRVIITTAHPQYAIPSFDYTSMVSHYVLKPIEADKLNHAVDKVIRELTSAMPAVPAAPVEKDRPFAHFSIGDREMKIYFGELICCESSNVNVRLLTPGQVYLTRGPLKEVLKKLPETHFLRVHESYVVNLHLIRGHSKRFDALDLKHEEHPELITVPIGRKYRQEVRQRLSGV